MKGRWASTALGIAVAVSLVFGVLLGVHPRAVAGVLGPNGLSPLAEPAAPVPTPVVHVTPETGLNPTKPITVSVTDGTATAVHVTDPKGKAVAGTLAPDGHTWTSTGDLAYSTTYAVAVAAVDVFENVGPLSPSDCGYAEPKATDDESGCSTTPAPVPTAVPPAGNSRTGSTALQARSIESSICRARPPIS